MSLTLYNFAGIPEDVVIEQSTSQVLVSTLAAASNEFKTNGNTVMAFAHTATPTATFVALAEDGSECARTNLDSVTADADTWLSYHPDRNDTSQTIRLSSTGGAIRAFLL